MVSKYIIMCGGNYRHWETPRHLSVVMGEELVARTIRLLKENGVKDISISSNNPVFEKFGLPVLKHDNEFVCMNHDLEHGKWYNCFYPTEEPVCYIFGDVYFSEDAIKTIVETETDDIEFFGSREPFAKEYIKDHEEPFALKVANQKHLREAIEKTKELEKQGKFYRPPIMWELWLVIKNAPLQVKGGPYEADYTVIDDYTCDIDWEEDIHKLDLKLFKDYKYKLSILTACYKTYDLMVKLFDRLIPQLTDEVEWIVIDDGCNEKRLDKYADKVKIIHLEKNKGGAGAYNKGILNSTGKYIAIVDSDDMVSEDYVETLINKINECDADTIFMDWQDMATGEIVHRPNNIAQWKCIYKRNIIPLFAERYRYSWDYPFWQKLNSKPYTRVDTDKVLYYYNSNRPDNLTNEKKKIIEKENEERRKNMIKCEVIKDFSLGRINEVKDLQRKYPTNDNILRVGDTFYCEKDLADYLLGDNARQLVVVKVIEVQPKEEIKEEIKEEPKIEPKVIITEELKKQSKKVAKKRK